MTTVTLSTIERGLALSSFDSLAAQALMTPSHRAIRRPTGKSGRPRLSAVLLLVYCREGEWHVILTKRRDDLSSHGGQISFPGGSREDGESLAETALRETCEEIGACPESVRLLGDLTTLYIPPSDFEVHPFVGYQVGSVEYRPDPNEVAELVEVSLRQLLDPATQKRELWELQGMQIEVPFYLVGTHKVWGATAMMLSEFLERLQVAIQLEAGLSSRLSISD